MKSSTASLVSSSFCSFN